MFKATSRANFKLATRLVSAPATRRYLAQDAQPIPAKAAAVKSQSEGKSGFANFLVVLGVATGGALYLDRTNKDFHNWVDKTAPIVREWIGPNWAGGEDDEPLIPVPSNTSKVVIREEPPKPVEPKVEPAPIVTHAPATPIPDTQPAVAVVPESKPKEVQYKKTGWRRYIFFGPREKVPLTEDTK